MRKPAWVMLTLLACILAAAAQPAAQAAIFEAAGRGDLETVARLLKADAKLVEATNPEGDTALHLAAGGRRGEEAALPVIRLLLESGAALEARNPSRQTYAVLRNKPAVVETLMRLGRGRPRPDPPASGRFV